jgi:hypothetical protein
MVPQPLVTENSKNRLELVEEARDPGPGPDLFGEARPLGPALTVPLGNLHSISIAVAAAAVVVVAVQPPFHCFDRQE